MNRLEEKAKRALAEVEYAMSLRLRNPQLTTEECFKISKEMHNMAEKVMDTSMVIESDISVGDIVECTSNTPIDEGYDGCRQLTVGQQYKVLEKLPTGMFFVDDPFTGRIADPFYPDRFKLIHSGADTSTAEQI